MTALHLMWYMRLPVGLQASAGAMESMVVHSVANMPSFLDVSPPRPDPLSGGIVGG